MKLASICESVVAISHLGASYIREQSKVIQASDIEEKGQHDLVSFVDKNTEALIKDGLFPLLPDAGFLAEESGTTAGNEFTWVIDPLDGTTNFVHGVPVYSISIALMQAGKPILGVVHEISRQECFYSHIGSGVYLNGKLVKVSAASKLDKSLIATGFPYSDFSRMEAYLKVFDLLMRDTRGIRRLGSAAVDLAYVACGRFEAFYEYGLHPWDVAAGAFLVEQAGGTNTDFAGDDQFIFGTDILASNGTIHKELLEIIKRHFSK